MKRETVKRFASVLLFMNLVGISVCAGAAPGKEAPGALKFVNFDDALGRAPARPCDDGDAVSRRILAEYGAVFVAEDVLPPPVCIFASAEEVASFQAGARTLSARVGGADIELQAAALRSLLFARAEARAEGLDITPRDGAEAARRDYADTVRIWESRLLPALEHWRRVGRLTEGAAARVRRLPVREQVGVVLELESRGLFFSKGFTKSILYSAAAPGASQHLSMLAFDAVEYADARVRRMLARHGWFRTVRNDAPHFTYLGLGEEQLPSRGLKRVATAEGEFWVPDFDGRQRQSPWIVKAAQK